MKEIIEKIFNQLTCLKTQDANECLDYGDFCFNYFGVRRKLDGVNFLYLLMNPDAYWVRDVDKSFLRKNGNSVYVNVQQFVFAARSHFRSELLSVGFKILDTLEALHKIAIKNSLSVFCQSIPLIHIFEVIRYLLRSKDLNVKYHDAKKLQIISDTTTVYFEYVFPLDCRKILDKNMISLRRSDISRRLLEDIVLLKIGLKGKLIYSELARVLMIILGSGNPSKEFVEKFEKIEENFPLEEFFKEIGWKKDSDFPENLSDTASDKHNFLRSFHNIMSVDSRFYCYLSPNCFLYLLEQLFLCSSFTREFFFTTKSALLEWIICSDSDFDDTSSDIHVLVKDMQLSGYGYRAAYFQQANRNGMDKKIWSNQYYPLLLLRLVVTLCLLCVNCNSYFHILSRLLEKNELTSWLSRDFVNVL